MRLHTDAVDVLTRWQAPSEEQDQVRAAHLAHLAEHPDGVWRTCFPAHLTAGALVVSPDRRQVLLNLHRKAGRWFHFGGHLEQADVTLAGAALRESAEESGLEGLAVQAEPLHVSTHAVEFCDPRGTVDHLDVRFLAVTGVGSLGSVGSVPVTSEESLDVRWWPVTALPTDDPDMVAMVRLALRR